MESKSPTEKKIVDTALTMFNESGIEYVGMRELAAALQMRVGNLTYYFPTKDDLVNRLSLNLAEANSKTIVPVEQVTMKVFFEMLRQVFRNHVNYRCLMLSFVHIMEQNPIIAKRYSKIQSTRSETWSTNIQALRKGKYISVDNNEVDFLVSTIGLIARFWISEAAISFKHLTEEQQMQHYTRLIAQIFLPFATAKGKRELEEILKERSHEV
ncbi:MAG TPA: TetR/AcrR family transcriptional regulator [Chryseolinea sp.]|nr:TetR/AcrR family transcriptional regulator [Chryseolinea sp.]